MLHHDDLTGGTRKSACRRLLLLVAAATIAGILEVSAGLAAEDPFDAAVQNDFAFAAAQTAATTTRISTTAYPEHTNSTGAWVTTAAKAWTSGFFPGSLWLLYAQSAGPSWASAAKSWQVGLKGQARKTTNSDLGFMIFSSYGNAYRLTGDDRFRQVVLKAAGSLATRFDPTVGALASRPVTPTDFKVVVDTMMNLELLFWASQHGGDPAWYDISVSHALRTMQNNVRPDGSVVQLVDYDPATGAVKSTWNPQGFSPTSTWSRGQAWAVYGFTMAYRFTRDARFLQTAERAADYYLAHLPSDYVPFWDFQDPAIPLAPRDSSSAAIAASGLTELGLLEPDPPRGASYLSGAKDILTSLSSPAYLAAGTSSQAVLLHGTQNKPKGKFDKGLSFGDYYFLEGLLRQRWILPNTARLAIAGMSASADDGNPAANAVDGDLATRWSAAGDSQWIRLDLGSAQTVHKVSIAWWQGDTRSARFDLQTSEDGSSWSTALNSLSNGARAGFETYDIPDATAQYVRIVGHGTTAGLTTGIAEIAVY